MRKLKNGKWRTPLTEHRYRLFSAQNGKCHWCHRSCHFSPSNKVNFPNGGWEEYRDLIFTVDHVEPLCGEGTNDPENFVGACFKCNQERNNRFQATLRASIAPTDSTF